MVAASATVKPVSCGKCFEIVDAEQRQGAPMAAKRSTKAVVPPSPVVRVTTALSM